jgi:hypothetical protein
MRPTGFNFANHSSLIPLLTAELQGADDLEVIFSCEFVTRS